MFYIIANFKSNLVRKDIIEYINFINKGLAVFSNKSSIKIIFCPPYPYLYLFEGLVKNYDYVSIGAQDVSCFLEGSFTGDVNAIQLSDYCKYCIVGHSERRLNYREGDDSIHKKLQNLVLNGISPIICASDIKQLGILRKEGIRETMVAYEPVDYIGGFVPAPLAEVNNFINKSGLTSIIYGGSVNSKNCTEYLLHKGISGFLIGNASLNALGFLKILQKANSLLRLT